MPVYIIPAEIWKELQRTSSFVAYEKMNTIGRSFTMAKQYDMMKSYYHGILSDTSCGFAKQLIQGLQRFKKMYEPDDTEIVTGFEVPNRLKLKFEYTRCENQSYFVGTGPDDVTLEMMRSKKKSGKGEPLAGATILNQGTKALENCRKAMGYALMFLHKERVQTEDPAVFKYKFVLPSGCSPENFHVFVLEKMYQDLEISEEKKAEYVAKGEPLPKPPKDYFFPGWMAFLLAGPLVDEEEQSTLFVNETPKAAASEGRAALRKQHLEENANKKKSASTKSKEAPTESSKAADRAHLIRRDELLAEEHTMEMTYHETSTLVASLKSELMAEIQLAPLICPVYDPTHEVYISIANLRKRHNAATNQLQREYLANKKQRVVLANKQKELSAAMTVGGTDNGGNDNVQQTPGASTSTEPTTGPSTASTNADAATDDPLVILESNIDAIDEALADSILGGN